MPGWFIFALIFFSISVIAGLGSFAAGKDDTKSGARAIFGFFLVLGILFTFISSFNTVPIRTVGVVTSFGKPTGDVTGSGAKMVAPWDKVGEWPASIQNWDHTGEGNDRIRVRTATMADAWVHVLVQWRVNPKKAPEQFLNYKGDFDSFKTNRVEKQLISAVNNSFARYNPLANIDTKSGNLNVDLKPYMEGLGSVKDLAQKYLGDDVEIQTVTIPRVDHNKETDEAIAQFNSKLAKGRNLDQDKINADKEKAITDVNAKRDKQAWCLEISEKTGSDPGLCMAGAASVIVDSRKTK